MKLLKFSNYNKRAIWPESIFIPDNIVKSIIVYNKTVKVEFDSSIDFLIFEYNTHEDALRAVEQSQRKRITPKTKRLDMPDQCVWALEELK
jgi:hypothetical protein